MENYSYMALLYPGMAGKCECLFIILHSFNDVSFIWLTDCISKINQPNKVTENVMLSQSLMLSFENWECICTYHNCQNINAIHSSAHQLPQDEKALLLIQNY